MRPRYPSGPSARWFLIIIGLAAGLAACGPADLAAVQKYAQVTADASSGFSAVAMDFGESCLRQREFTIDTAVLPTTNVMLAPGFIPGPTPAPSVAPSPAGGFDDPQCTQARAVSDEWDKRNKVILGYVQALGAIAGVDARPTFAPLGTALVGAKMLTTAQDTAFTHIAAVLTGAIVTGRERDAIGQTVTAVEPALPVAVDALKTVDAAYAQELNAEYNQTFVYYNAMIRSELPAPGATFAPGMRDTIFLQRQRFSASLDAINKRRASTIAYAGTLDAIRATDERLYAQTHARARLADYVAVLNADLVPLYQSVGALQKATK